MHARIAPERLLWCVKRRMPSRATRSGRMVGMTSPMLASSAGSSPDKAASDMPCTFPLVLVDGVFMSARASTQATPRGRSYGPGGHAVVAPPQHHGCRPSVQVSITSTIEPWTRSGDIPNVLLARAACRAGFPAWAPECASTVHGVAQRPEEAVKLSDSGTADEVAPTRRAIETSGRGGARKGCPTGMRPAIDHAHNVVI